MPRIKETEMSLTSVFKDFIENKKIVALSIRNKTTRQRVFCEDNRKREKVA